MKLNKKIKSGLAIVALSAGMSYGLDVTMGGNIQTVNSITGSGEMGLDFTSPAADFRIATFVVNNNTTSFDLSFDLNHATAIFERGGQTVPMTDVYVDKITAFGAPNVALAPTLASGATGPTDSNLKVQWDAAGVWTWNPADQTAATVNGQLGLYADWAASTNLAGLYTAIVTVILTPTL